MLTDCGGLGWWFHGHLLKMAQIIAIPNPIAMIAITSENVIQIGANTHHHDHAITLQSFRVMKTMVSSPANPMPPVLFAVLLMLIKEILKVKNDGCE